MIWTLEDSSKKEEEMSASSEIPVLEKALA